MTDQSRFQVEQVLYYSVPGALLILLTLASAFVLGLKLNLDAALLTAALLGSIPIGFTVFQAYHSNALYVRRIVLGKEPSAAALSKIKKELTPLLGEKRSREVAGGILNLLMEEKDRSGYRNRVRDVVNSKGTCLLVSILGAFIPLGSIGYCGAWAIVQNGPCTTISPVQPNLTLFPLYYALIVSLAVIFHAGNRKLMKHASLHEDIIASNNKELIITLGKEMSTAQLPGSGTPDYT